MASASPPRQYQMTCCSFVRRKTWSPSAQDDDAFSLYLAAGWLWKRHRVLSCLLVQRRFSTTSRVWSLTASLSFSSTWLAISLPSSSFDYRCSAQDSLELLVSPNIRNDLLIVILAEYVPRITVGVAI